MLEYTLSNCTGQDYLEILRDPDNSREVYVEIFGRGPIGVIVELESQHTLKDFRLFLCEFHNDGFGLEVFHAESILSIT